LRILGFQGPKGDVIAGLAERTALIASVLLGLGVVLVTTFWWLTEQAEEQRPRIAAEATARQMRLRLEAWFADRLMLVEYLADHQVEAHQDRPDRYRRAAGTIIGMAPGFQALNLVDTAGVIRIVVPREGNVPALGKDLSRHPSPDVRAALARARRTGRAAATGVIDLLQGGRGFATYVPVRDRQGRLRGFVNGVFRIDNLVRTCLTDGGSVNMFRYVLTGPDGRVAYRSAPGDPRRWPYAVSQPLRIADRQWTLALAPAAAALASNQGWLNEVVALVGLLLVGLLAWSLRRVLESHRALRESRHQYRVLVENQADMIVRLSPAGELLYASPSYFRNLGLAADDVDREFLPFVHEHDREHLEQSLSRVLAPPHETRCLHRHLTETGQVWLAWSFRGVAEPDGDIREIVGVGRDVTEQKELEGQLRLLQRQQSLILMAGGIVRDLANNLQVMLGQVEGALDEVPPGPGRTRLENLARGIERAAWLGRRLLNMGRDQRPRPRPVDLVAVARDLGRLLERTLDAGESLDLDLPAERVPVHADPDLVEQALLNLAVTLRSLGEGGPIRLALAIRERGDDRVDKEVCVTVARRVPGLPAADLQRLLDPFFASNRFGEGVGMAVASASAVIQQHDGCLQIHHAVDSTLEFQVWWPLLRDVPGDAGLDAAGRLPAGNGEAVLVADPDPEVRDHLAALLAGAGYTVLQAREAGDVEALVRAQPDRLRAVVAAGNWAGPELWRLREAVPRLVFLVLSCGDVTGAAVRAANSAPWLRVLDKPVPRRRLLETLHDLLARRQEPLPLA